MTQNPRQQPYGARRHPTGAPAGATIRLLARVLDTILVAIVSAILSWIFDWNAHGWFSNGTFIEGVVSSALLLAYFVVLESFRGRTFAKELLGLRVVGSSGGNPSLRESTIRNCFVLLTVIPFGLGGFLEFIAWIVVGATIAVSPTKQGRHDIAAETRVISSS